MDEYRYLSHYGIKDMKWGVRRFQDYAGQLTAAGRIRYGVGQGLHGGVFDSSRSVSKRARRLGNFGVELAKAKSYQYANSGRYKMRKAKSRLASMVRGKEANSNIERMNRRKVLDYRAARHMAERLMREFGKDAAKEVMDGSNERFARRISAGKSYVHNMGLFAVGERSRAHVARGVVDLHNLGYENYSRPTVSRYREFLRGSTRLR